MPTVKLSPILNDQVTDETGAPAVGWKIYTYTAGSSTPQVTYTTSAGDVQQPNPIVLDALGFSALGPIWLASGVLYKFVLTDENDVVKKTFDNIAGTNDSTATTSQWIPSGVPPTYISGTSFSVPGDQTSEFHIGRREQFATGAGTLYGTITGSVYNGTTLTTVTVQMDSGALDNGLTVVNHSILRADNIATPATMKLAYSGHVGLSGANDGTTPNSKFSITTIATTYRNAQGGTLTVKSGTTLTGDITVAGPAANGRDQAAAFSANAKVHVYKIYNGATEALIFSLAEPSVGPALPTGYTYVSYAGTVVLDGSANLRRMFMADDAMYFETQLVTLAASGSAASQAVSHATYVPTFAVKVMIDSYGLVTTSAATTAVHFIRLSSTGGNWKVDQVATESAGTGYGSYSNVMTVPNLASQSIYTGWVSNAAVATVSSTLAVLGFTVPNGAV